jgi:hypothetical protein
VNPQNSEERPRQASRRSGVLGPSGAAGIKDILAKLRQHWQAIEVIVSKAKEPENKWGSGSRYAEADETEVELRDEWRDSSKQAKADKPEDEWGNVGWKGESKKPGDEWRGGSEQEKADESEDEWRSRG